MDLRVKSNPDKQPKINGKKLDKTTLVFKTKKEARKCAEFRRSYVFEVSIIKVEVEEHYGYGVPK